MKVRWRISLGCMMEGLGKERSICSASPFPWLSHPQTEASTLLWKLKDCFSTSETTTSHHTDKEVGFNVEKKTLSLHWLVLECADGNVKHTSFGTLCIKQALLLLSGLLWLSLCSWANLRGITIIWLTLWCLKSNFSSVSTFREGIVYI